MGLKTLLSNLNGGQNPNARSGFTEPTFQQKSFNIYDSLDRPDHGPFVRPVTWNLNDPLAEPTYNDTITKRNQWEVNNLDGLLGEVFHYMQIDY